MTDTQPVPRVAELAERVARFVHELDVGLVPDSARRSVYDRLRDTLGVGIAGSATASSQNVVRALRGLDAGAGTARVWGQEAAFAPAQAALANAAAVHAEDFDDTHTAGVVHGSACVVPAAWAAAEAHGLPMANVHRGVLAGWEVAARIGIASQGAFHRRGLHTTSVAGVFGAAAAAAATWGLAQDEVIAALGLAGSAAAGVNAYLEDGTQGKILNPAYAAQAGVQAAAFARAGMTGPARVLDGRLGVLNALGEGTAHLDAAFESLSEDWEISRVSTKPFPACHFSHATIDAVLDLRQPGLSPQDVARIVCRLPEATWDLLCRPWESKLDPKSAYAVRFSIPWLVSLALIDGEVSASNLNPSVLEREDIRTLARKVSIEDWEDSPYPRTFPGSVTVTTVDGEVRSVTRLVNRGHPDDPLTDRDLRQKFTSCLSVPPADPAAIDLYEALADPAASPAELGESIALLTASTRLRGPSAP